MGKKSQIGEKQSQIKECLSKIGWSQKKFARIYYCHIHDTDIEEEIKQFEEKIKKQLSRPTTSIKLLEQYLCFLYSQEEVKKIDLVTHFNHSEFDFDSSFGMKMYEISKMLSKKISSKK